MNYDEIFNDSELQLTCLCGVVLTEENSRHGSCNNCLNDEWDAAFENESDESMDGDHESGLASAGFGTDEDYCHDTPLYEDYYGGE